MTLVLERSGAAPVKVMADVSSRITSAHSGSAGPTASSAFVGQRATPVGRARRLPHLGTRSRRPRPRAGSGAVRCDAAPGARRSPGADRADPASRPSRSREPCGSPIGPSLSTAIVTAPATLLDATGRRIVVQDALGAPSSSCCRPTSLRHRSGPGSAPRAGSASPTARLGSEPTGSSLLGPRPLPAPLVLHGMPGAGARVAPGHRSAAAS